MASKRLEFIKAQLNLSNDTSYGAFSDPITGQLVPGGGLLLGDFIDITDAEAATLSGVQGVTLYGGRYRRVKVDAAATAANVKQGTIAFLTTAAKGNYVVTDYAHCLATSLVRGAFLNAITPGNYGWIQEMGTATVLGGAAFVGAAAIGVNLNVSATTPGTVDIPTTTSANSNLTVAVAIDLPVVASLFRAQLDNLVWQG